MKLALITFAALVIAALIAAFTLNPGVEDPVPPHTQPAGRVGTTATGPGNGLEGVREVQDRVIEYVAAVEAQHAAEAAVAPLVAHQDAWGSQATDTVGVAPPADSSGIPPAWQCIAMNEVGGNWAMHGSKYSGIGFLNAAWDQWGGREFAANAGDATPMQQVTIGRKIVNAVGPSAWSTAAMCGLERGM